MTYAEDPSPIWKRIEEAKGNTVSMADTPITLSPAIRPDIFVLAAGDKEIIRVDASGVIFIRGERIDDSQEAGRALIRLLG